MQFPSLAPKHVALGAYVLFVTLNIIGVQIAAAFELAVTLLAIAELLDGLVLAGSKKKDLQAHIYGGACVLRAFRSGTRKQIGDQNVRLALEILSRERIPVVRQETGGEKGRKITMRTDTGVVSFKVIGT